MKDTVKARLANHQVDFSMQKRRHQLSKQWGAEQIFDCMPLAAKLILTYSTLQNKHDKESLGSGRCLFFWDRKDISCLYIQRLSSEKIFEYKLTITSEGILEFESLSFQNLDEVLEALSLQTHIVHHQIKIAQESTLEKVLNQRFDFQCPLYYPPDYPPLLIHIALLNDDFATAAMILENPYIDDPVLPREQNYRLAHLLEVSSLNAIVGKYLLFLEYLIEKYDLLRLYTYPLSQAIQCDNRELAKYLMDRFPKSQLSKAFEEAMLMALNTENEDIFRWLLNDAPKHFAENSLIFSSPFLASLFERFGAQAFETYIEKMQVHVPWNELLSLLIETSISPTSYLLIYRQAGYLVEDLPQETKVKMLTKVMNGESIVGSLQEFSNEFFFVEDVEPLMTAALMGAWKNKNQVQALLDLGALPKKEHFEALLKAYEYGEERLQIFSQLLGSFSDISDAKKNLSIASAFGDEAVKAIFQKFPPLAHDVEFLNLFMEEMWKGSLAATDRLLAEMLSVGSKQKSVAALSPIENSPLPLENNYLPPSLGQRLSVDILIDVYLLRNQVEKIASVLQQKPECIEDFWWRTIFSGFSNYNTSEWHQLALETFSKMDQKKQDERIKAAFSYSHLQLASLWIKVQSIVVETVFSWFDAALISGNVEAVNVFAEHHLHFLMNEKGESLLYKAAENNAIEFVVALQKLGLDPDLPSYEGITPYKCALEWQHVTICHKLHGPECFAEMTEHLLKLPKAEIQVWLLKAFLRGSAVDVAQLIGLFRLKVTESSEFDFESLNELEHFMQTSGSLIIRFPFPRTQAEMYAAYGNAYQNYEQQQWLWGLECERIYQKFFKNHFEKEHLILELLMKLTKELSKKKDYDTWRMGAEESSLITYLCGRYFFFLQFTQKTYKDLLKDPTSFQTELRMTEEGYQILYPLNDDTSVSLSILQIRKPFEKDQFSARMIHTHPKEVKLLIPHLETLFNEIKNFQFPLGEKPQSPPPELKKKIAQLFWLGCQLAVTARGSSQYMLMLHRLLYNIHGYETAPWSLRYIQPDCMAIILPFSIFFAEYYDLLFDVD